MKLAPIFKKDFPLTQGFWEAPEIYSRFNLAGHNWLDFAAPEWTPIFSPIDWRVYLANYQATGYWKYLKLRSDDFELIFWHLSLLLVQTWEVVKKWQVIWLTWSTGFSTGPHLHFWLRVLENKLVVNYANWYFGYVDPVWFFESYFDSWLVYKEKIWFTNLAKNYDLVPEWAVEGYDFVLEEWISNWERASSEISREEFWLMLLRFSESIWEEWKLDKTFDFWVLNLDVADRPSEWAEDCYAFVVSEHISNWERPKEFLTREELWTVLFRFFDGYEQFKLNVNTSKVEWLSDWAIESYYWVKTNSISSWERPWDYISRAEVWKTLLNCFEVLED